MISSSEREIDKLSFDGDVSDKVDKGDTMGISSMETALIVNLAIHHPLTCVQSTIILNNDAQILEMRDHFNSLVSWYKVNAANSGTQFLTAV